MHDAVDDVLKRGLRAAVSGAAAGARAATRAATRAGAGIYAGLRPGAALTECRNLAIQEAKEVAKPTLRDVRVSVARACQHVALGLLLRNPIIHNADGLLVVYVLLAGIEHINPSAGVRIRGVGL